MRDMRELMIAFDEGDHINDAELEHMRQRLEATKKELEILWYDKYQLMLRDVWSKLEAVQRYQQSRKQRF